MIVGDRTRLQWECRTVLERNKNDLFIIISKDAIEINIFLIIEQTPTIAVNRVRR